MSNYSSPRSAPHLERSQQSILDFWFGPAGGGELESRPEWFKKDAAFDQQIRNRFGVEVEQALNGEFESWPSTATGSLALVLLLDQFTRNIFRGTPRAFAGDPKALRTAEQAVSAGFDQELLPWHRSFLYMPFEHAESISAQQTSVRLFQKLKDETGLTSQLEWTRKHAEIIQRFGRFPHRNAILGRMSTEEELAFLKEPGSSF